MCVCVCVCVCVLRVLKLLLIFGFGEYVGTHPEVCFEAASAVAPVAPTPVSQDSGRLIGEPCTCALLQLFSCQHRFVAVSICFPAMGSWRCPHAHHAPSCLIRRTLTRQATPLSTRAERASAPYNLS